MPVANHAIPILLRKFAVSFARSLWTSLDISTSFRYSKKLVPGLRLNVGKKSASLRIGGKNFGYTTGTAGRRVTAGVPGTGISYTRSLERGSTGRWGWFILFVLAC
jgi:hypothetical protein